MSFSKRAQRTALDTTESAASLQRQAVGGAAPAPTVGGPPATAPAPAVKKVKVWMNTFIPMRQVPVPVAPSVGPFSACLAGDGRGFSNFIHASYRTHQEIEFDPSTFATILDWKDTGTSHLQECLTGAVIVSAKASTSTIGNAGPLASGGGNARVDFQVDAAVPVLPAAPAINLDLSFHVDPIRRLCMITGEHDGFPAYEGYVAPDGGAGVPVYTYDPRAHGAGPTNLFPP